MKFQIKHSITGRMRVHLFLNSLSCKDADLLQCYLLEQTGISQVKIYERTADIVILYSGDQYAVISVLKKFSFDVKVSNEKLLENSSRELNKEYKEKLITTIAVHYGRRMLLPAPIRHAWIAIKSLKYIAKGIACLLRGKIQVDVLDATAIGVSVLRGDYNTAGSVMLLLGIGELLEEWTHKKSVGDLARSMSLNVSKVCMIADGNEVVVDTDQVQVGDLVLARMGNAIAFDGTVVSGEAMVNQSSMTGEPLPVHKTEGAYVYAGTVIEDGEITIKVKETSGSTRYEKIVKMIEETDKLKSSVESKAYHLADRLVPITFAGTGLAYFLTRNITKTLSVLMVDFSCALKLAMPLSVLSAIREGSENHITIKGGKFLEAVANADTIVFDKTGTLTKAKPVVREIISFGDYANDELLKIAACLEEHFPHSMAKAVVDEALSRGVDHEEFHGKVEYIIAHGIASDIDGKKVVIGSYHFVFQDEKCIVPEGYEHVFKNLPLDCSHLYMAIDKVLVAVICIEDPLREEAYSIVKRLKSAGLKKVVMMTGDSDRTAKEIAKKVGVDSYYSEVLPEDKAKFVEEEKKLGNTVMMVGDGINDSPALSAADVGIAVSDGAEIAREIADITISEDSLEYIIFLKKLSNALMDRINRNYRNIVSINAGLIGLGVLGIIMPTTSALLHNTSTLLIGLKSMRNLLGEEDKRMLCEEEEAVSQPEEEKSEVKVTDFLALRKEKNLSQKALSELTGISVQEIRKIEHGLKQPDEIQYGKLCKALEINS